MAPFCTEPAFAGCPPGYALTCAFIGERATGIEPAFSAWEADVLPLNYARERPKVSEDTFRHPPTEGYR